MKLRLFPGALAAVVAVLSGCSSGSSGSSDPHAVTTVRDPAAFTVSYRNQVRLPWDGSALTADRFAQQLASKDPVGPVRCGAESSQAYRDITDFLGGIAWTHPMAIVKDASLPPLYTGKMDFSERFNGAVPSASDASSASAPNIERPDLVGVRNGIAVFLSKLHGLIAVDARSAAATPSCSMKLPGSPMNFFFKGDELVVVVNALGGFNRSALLRYSFKDGKFAFVDAVRLPDQNIVDARLFDSTLVLYTNWTKDREPIPLAEPNVGSGPTSGMYYGGGVSSLPMGDMGGASPYYGGGDRLGAKVIVVQWDDALAVDWEDALLDDPKKQDPMEGMDPKTPLSPGQVVSTWKGWAGFVAASDRYLAIPRSVSRSKFSRYETYNYQVCTNYNAQHHQVQQCTVEYKKQANPDYKAPDPATGDYSCNGKKLQDCITEAAPVVSQYVYVPVGQTCSMVWVGQCEKYEPRSETYPVFDTDQTTELTIYKFADGSFTKFDNTLSTLVQKPDAITFTQSPLEVRGSVSTRNQIQFQNGQLYVFADSALQTMAVAGNSVSYVNRLDISANTNNTPAVVFSKDRAMISSYAYESGSTQQSQVAMLDLSEPALPKPLTSFTMPGQTTQLMLASGGILGPGQVSFSNAQVQRSLQKVTLFSNADGNELDNLLLGTEYDTFESSWFAQQDDQRIRLGDSGTRLFLPYSGQHHADQYAPTAHRLNISRIENNRLVSERSFEVSDDIIRTAAVDDVHSLVFGDSAAYMVDHSSGDWAISTIREMFVPFATYRVSDSGLIARIDRVGSKCRVSTYAKDADIFTDAHLGQADVSCGEYTLPTGFASSVLWSATQTGVSISADGKSITVMSQADVAASLAKIPQEQYCYVDNGTAPSTSIQSIDYLDAVPASIACASTRQP